MEKQASIWRQKENTVYDSASEQHELQIRRQQAENMERQRVDRALLSITPTLNKLAGLIGDQFAPMKVSLNTNATFWQSMPSYPFDTERRVSCVEIEVTHTAFYEHKFLVLRWRTTRVKKEVVVRIMHEDMQKCWVYDAGIFEMVQTTFAGIKLNHHVIQVLRGY